MIRDRIRWLKVQRNIAGESLQPDREVQKTHDNKDPKRYTGEIICSLKEQHNDQSNEGWTQINRQKKKMEAKESRVKKNTQPLLQIHAYKLRQQRKCFRCLLKGHIQAVCKNSRRCLYCNEIGHIIRDCPSRPGEIPSASQRKGWNFEVAQRIPSSQSKESLHKPHPQKKEHTFKHPNRDMAISRDWLTMPMNEPVQLWQERPASLDAYIAPRAELSPANLFLERSALIFAGAGASDPYLN